MYLITQNWIYLLLAMLLGALIAWLLNLCNCNNVGLTEELDATRAERDELASRLAARPTQSTARDDARVAALEAEIAELKSKSKSKTTKASVNNDELDTIKARNSFLENRVKFLEEGNNTAASFVAPAAALTNENFEMSSAGKMDSKDLEAAITAAGDGKRPAAVSSATGGDDLLLIDGVGPKNNEWLKQNGIHYFWQIATMNVEELAWLANNLPNFGTRVYRENWVQQCANLAKGLPPR